MMQKISEFKGDYTFLSNFYPCKFQWNGFYWNTSENAYQSAKSVDYWNWVYLSGDSITPGKAKRFGRGLTLRPDWETVKFELMLQIVRSKFEQNPQLFGKLKATAPALLEEGNTWGDRIWGVSPPNSGNGKNGLGLILMHVRDL